MNMLRSIIKSTLVKYLQPLLSEAPLYELLWRPHSGRLNADAGLENTPNPYVKISNNKNAANTRDDVIFVTSRFRSGSTLLWNLFRQSSECTSFYEPLNERKWFNASARGYQTDNTHRGVTNYWQEYTQVSGLDELYDEAWIHSNLYMDERCYAPAMRQFIDSLIEQAPARPVLQFNRVDFRLPWLKYHYPNAKILHLFRHPREVWCSFLTDKSLMNKDDVQYTYQDNFYLDVWCRDLAKQFPLLDIRYTPHPYRRFYYLWKLSYLMGQKWADINVSFEDLVLDSEQTVSSLLTSLGLPTSDLTKYLNLFNPPALDGWKQYADETWFSAHETECEKQLSLILDQHKHRT